MDNFATAISLSLQYGVPLKALVDKFQHVRFEPSGWTNNADIHYAKSVTDYIFRWLGMRFVSQEYAGIDTVQPQLAVAARAEPTAMPEGFQAQETPVDGPLCVECGSIMSVNGSCLPLFPTAARLRAAADSGRSRIRPAVASRRSAAGVDGVRVIRLTLCTRACTAIGGAGPVEPTRPIRKAILQ